MRANIAEGSLVRIEIQTRHNGSIGFASQHGTQRGSQGDSNLPHVLVLVDDGPQKRRLVVDLLEQEDLVVVAIIGGHARVMTSGVGSIPFVEIGLRVEALRSQAGVGESPQQLRQFLQLLRISEAQHQLQDPGEVALGVVVAIVNL